MIKFSRKGKTERFFVSKSKNLVSDINTSYLIILIKCMEFLITDKPSFLVIK